MKAVERLQSFKDELRAKQEDWLLNGKRLPKDPALEKEYTMDEAMARLKVLIQKNKKPQ